jgi:methionyl-tRNA formyltransferase
MTHAQTHSPLRLAFLGSPPFATVILARLLESAFKPVVVVTAPDRPAGRGRRPQPSPVAELSRAAGIECLRPERLRPVKGTGSLSPERLRLMELKPDLVLVASYGELLDSAFLALPRLGCFNLHASLLPRHRGATPIQAAILAGDQQTGVCIQRIVPALDAGDLVLARKTEIGPEETFGELFNRLAHLGAEATLEALELLASGRATFTPQDNALATHCRKLDRSAGALCWEEGRDVLLRQIRAFTPRPGAFAQFKSGEAFKVLQARAAEVGQQLTPGELGTELADASPRFLVGTGLGGAIEILGLQPAGKRALGAAEFLRGARLKPGTRLEPVTLSASEQRPQAAP